MQHVEKIVDFDNDDCMISVPCESLPASQTVPVHTFIDLHCR